MKDSLKRQRNEALAIPDGGSPRVEQRVAAADWNAVNAALDANGFATMTGLLDAEACGAIIRLYPEDHRFRSHIHMARHGFGRGEYKYIAYPLPDAVGALRTALYPPLASIANRWNEALGEQARFPVRHADCGNPWPPMPAIFLDLATRAAATAGFEDFFARCVPHQPLRAGCEAEPASKLWTKWLELFNKWIRSN